MYLRDEKAIGLCLFLLIFFLHFDVRTVIQILLLPYFKIMKCISVKSVFYFVKVFTASCIENIFISFWY